MANTLTALMLPDESQPPTLIKTVTKVTKTKRTGDIEEKIENTYAMDIGSGPGVIYGDTDSVAGDSLVTLNGVTDSIANLFETIPGVLHVIDDKEFKQVSKCSSITGESVAAIYRHRSSKRRFKITTEDGKQVIVTEDHSIMIKRDRVLCEIKPMEINVNTDICISIKNDYMSRMP